MADRLKNKTAICVRRGVRDWTGDGGVVRLRRRPAGDQRHQCGAPRQDCGGHRGGGRRRCGCRRGRFVEADVKALVAKAVETYGRLDIAVANAGIIPLGDAFEIDVDAWDRVMAIDGRGMFLTCKYAIEAMLKTGGGSIVCTSSISGEAGQKRQAAYGPAKFVASGLTKHLAIEWADKGIRVNAVAPGTINTERVQQLVDEPGGPEYLDVMKAQHPVGRIGEPIEVAQAILFLVRRRLLHHRRRAPGRRRLSPRNNLSGPIRLLHTPGPRERSE